MEDILPISRLNNYLFDHLVSKGIIESYNLNVKRNPAQQAAIDKLNKLMESYNQNVSDVPESEYD